MVKEIAKRICVFVAAVTALWLVASAVYGIAAVEHVLHPFRLGITARDSARAAATAKRTDAELHSVAIAAEDGTLLRGWAMRPQNGNNSTVLLLHGMGDNRASMLGYAEMLLRHGFSVLLPDARAQGSSGGSLATFGVMESGDVRRWYEWVVRWTKPDCVFGLGESMGAGQLLDALKEVPEMCAVVAESSFATFEQAAYERVGQQFGTGQWLGRTALRPVVWSAFLYARLRYGVDLDQASPERSVAVSHVPVLLIHGREDTDLSPRHSEMMKAANHAIALWEPPDAGHTGASTAEPHAFEQYVVSWFKGHERQR